MFSGYEEGVQFLQLLLIDVGNKFEMHEFLNVPNCNCNLSGRDLRAESRMQINMTKGEIESNTVVILINYWKIPMLKLALGFGLHLEIVESWKLNPYRLH